MNWRHECKLDWLKARQAHLTATDIKDLLPVTKTGRKRTIGDLDYLKVLARKTCALTEDDCISTGAAARGHILEPYAIAMFNEEYAPNWGVEPLYHWDDALIASTFKVPMSLSYSPDAMSFPQDIEELKSLIDGENPVRLIPKGNTKIIGEVKSYYGEKHVICGNTPKMELEERWQIATAMVVDSSIENGYLIFYNPSMDMQMFVVEYSRSDLIDEMDTIRDIEKDWQDWLTNNFPIAGSIGTAVIMGDHNEEQRIIEQIQREHKLDPIATV